MNFVYDLLERLTEIGATVRPAGDRLILRAGSKPVPAELVWRIHEAKAEILATLSPVETEARPWRERFTALTFAWSAGKRNWETARHIAWGHLQNEWHDLHGRRWPTWQCAGCGKVIGGVAAIDLPDGNRVHFEPIQCLIRFGRRWRGDADAALIGLGLTPPDAGDEVP
jgi:hypothetical protein